MTSPRTSHLATPLQDGRALLSCGQNYNANTALVPIDSTYVYTPDALFKDGFGKAIPPIAQAPGACLIGDGPDQARGAPIEARAPESAIPTPLSSIQR